MTNKWLSNNCPNANDFFVDKSHTSYWISYHSAKKNVVELNENMKTIKTAVESLKNDIEALKGAIDSQDYRNQTASVIAAIDAAVAEAEKNMTKLFTSVVNRLVSCAESDSWFGDTASMYAEYIATTILGVNGAKGINVNLKAINNETQVSPASTATTTEEPKKTGFWGRVGATLGTFASGFVEGIVNIGELATDAVTLGTAALLTPITATADAVGAVSSAITGTEYKSSTASLWKDTAAFVSKDYSTDWFDSYYENTTLGKTLKDNSYAFDFTRGAGKLTGEVVTVNAIGSAVSALSSGAQAVSSGTSIVSSSGRVATSGSTQLALTSSSSLPAVSSAGTITRATGAAYSSVGNGSIMAEVLDASGNVIGTTTARVISSTPVSSGANAFRSAASFVGNAARNVGTAAANSSAGVTAASIAAVGGTAETIKQSTNSNA